MNLIEALEKITKITTTTFLKIKSTFVSNIISKKYFLLIFLQPNTSQYMAYKFFQSN